MQIAESKEFCEKLLTFVEKSSILKKLSDGDLLPRKRLEKVFKKVSKRY